MPSQHELLHHDVQLARELVADRNGEFPGIGDLSAPGRHNLVLVVAELLFRVLDLSAGLGAVLEAKRFTSAQALMRALMETVTTLTWLWRQAATEDAAWLYTAYCRMKIESLVGEDAPAPNVGQALSDIPENFRTMAGQHLAGRRNWSGKSAHAMFQDCGFPYLPYSWGSEEIHGRGMGVHVGVTETGPDQAEVRFGIQLDEDNIELQANCARLFLLSSVTAFWRIVFDQDPTLYTDDPRAWRQASADPE